MKVISVVGARPNFMKIAPIVRSFSKVRGLKHVLVHTGQHYDYKMSESFFKELGIPRPDINLEVGSANHGQQTAQIMIRFEKILMKQKPDLVLVVGDVNSTMACSLVAKKLHIAVAHVEAGLRSNDRRMPEEINRVVTDSISDILFTTCRDADQNLKNEGIPNDRICFVGNVMIDTLLANIKKSQKTNIVARLSLQKKEYVLVTLHRPSNVDSRKTIVEIFAALKKLQKHMRIIFPVHPRTKKAITKHIGKVALKKMENLTIIDPLGYFDFLALMNNARVVITDSGGIQEETTVLGVPCLTVRKNTERPITITEGTNTLVGTDKEKIIKVALRAIQSKKMTYRKPKYWDGRASERIVKKIVQLYKNRKLERT